MAERQQTSSTYHPPSVAAAPNKEGEDSYVDGKSKRAVAPACACRVGEMKWIIVCRLLSPPAAKKGRLGPCVCCVVCVLWAANVAPCLDLASRVMIYKAR